MTITVYGIPAPQGSKRHIGRGVMIESSKKVKPWREAVKWAAIESMDKSALEFGGAAVHVRVDFYLPKPKSAKKTALPTKKPDLDKLIRSTMDALTDAGVWCDDSQVLSVWARKHYAEARAAGAEIEVTD